MKTPRHHADLVRESFSPRADAYLKSAVHASGPDLDRLDALLRGHAQAELLDLGCGGGHVSYLAAARVRRVIDLRDDSERIMRKNYPNSVYYTRGLERKEPWWKLW